MASSAPMAVNVESHPVSKRPSWLLLCTGGLLTAGGLGWCLRRAYAEKPKLAIATYLTGSAGVCLINMAFYRPVKKSSAPNWILLLTGGILSGAGFSYFLILSMKEQPKSTMIAYIVGSLGYILTNSAVYAATMSGNSETKPEAYYSKTEAFAKETSHIIKCENPRLNYVGGRYQCQTCEACFQGKNSERDNVEKKSERTLAMEKPVDFLRKMQKSRLEVNIECEKNLAAEKICNEGGLYREIMETSHENGAESDRKRRMKYKSREETTQTESQFRMMGTQTQKSDLVQQQQVAEGVLDEDEQSMGKQ